MSDTPNRRARRAAERELRRLERRLATNPARPILRAAERRHPPGGPDESVRAADRPQEALPPPPTHLPPPNDGSAFPLWARLLTLPPNLDPSFRQFLFRHIETVITPRDAHEHWLAARIATAMARLHLNAQREPESPGPAWLRYETLADRQLRQAHRDLKAHRASLPATNPHPTPTPPRSVLRDPQSQPSPHDPTFARTIPETPPPDADSRPPEVSPILHLPGCPVPDISSVPGPALPDMPRCSAPSLTPRSPAAPA